MSSTSAIPMNYLKVPCEKTSVVHNSRQNSLSNEHSKQIDERNGSNSSLSSSTHGIIKNSNAPRQHQPISPHHISIVDNAELITPSSIIPTKVSSSRTTKPNRKHSSSTIDTIFRNPPHQMGFCGLFQYSHRTKPFAYSKSNDENADAYKIVSILYGLIVFIGGVALSISHAIITDEEAEKLKYLAEIYFTYLYWVSIIWIVFCICDIVHHRQKITFSTKSRNKSDAQSVTLSDGKRAISTRKSTLPLLNEPTSPSSPGTPFFNLQIFDDSDEFQSDDELPESNQERPDRHEDDADIDLDYQHDEHHDATGSDSMNHRSSRSSAMMRKQAETARDVKFRRHALDPGGAHSLRTYVRDRKDSIVQRVIGYNYDDHSTAGGLYIRVGIGIFCLGTVIHSGLSILSNLENPNCLRWTAAMDDFSRLLFSFIQFFFIFKNSNLIIRAHESLARLAVLHIVVTNLCVWFRMVVIETKSQILEMKGHEITATQLANITHSLSGSPHSTSHGVRPLTRFQHCVESVEDARQMSAVINEGYMRLKPLLYPCTIEFSLMCLTLFFLIWENIGKTFAHKTSDKASSKNVFMVNCHASIKGLFAGMIVFSCTVISIILYAVFRNKIGDDTHSISSFPLQHDTAHLGSIHIRAVTLITTLAPDRHSLILPVPPSAHGPFTSISKTPKKIVYSIAIVEIVNLCLLVISLTATTCALLKIRKLQYKRTTTRFDDVLILVSLTGTYLYSIFSAFALLNRKTKTTWIAYLKIVIVVLEFVEATVHAFFILVALRKRLHRANKNQYPAREIITLLIMLDLSLWFEETTTTTKHEANPFQLAFYHVVPWSIIAAIATPLQIFFRFHASVCLSHVWENMYILPTYGPVAPHGL